MANLTPLQQAYMDTAMSPDELKSAYKGLSTLGLDLTPIVGDVKALGYDLPKYAQAGDKLGVGLSLLSAIPFIPNLNKGRTLPLSAPVDQSKVTRAQQVVAAENPVAVASEVPFGTVDEAVSGALSPSLQGPRNLSELKNTENLRKQADYQTYTELRNVLGKEDAYKLLERDAPFGSNIDKLIHYSNVPITKFNPEFTGLGPHFGLPEQGLSRSLQNPMLKPMLDPDAAGGLRAILKDFYMPEYALRTGNILRMGDVAHSSPFSVLQELKFNPQLTSAERSMFSKMEADLLETYLQKVKEMSKIIRETDKDLYVPDISPFSMKGVTDVSILENIPFNKRFYDFKDVTDLSEKAFSPIRAKDAEFGKQLVTDYGRRVFTEPQFAAQKVNQKQLDDLRKILLDLDYDTIAYANRAEIPLSVRLRQGQAPVGADSYISLNPDRNVKLRDALEFNPDIPDVRFAQGGIVSLRRH